MKENLYEKLYDWEKLKDLIKKFGPEVLEEQLEMKEEDIAVDMPLDVKEKLENIGFSKEGKNPEEVTRELIDYVYPYRMKINHPRYFSFIPNDASPYSIFGDMLNSIYNPYGGGEIISEGTALLEKETIKWMGSLIGYDKDKLGGQFVSGGSMANLTGSIVARDDKLKPEEFIKGIVYVSDQTHSSVAKGVHVMGIPRDNVRKIKTDEEFKMKPEELEKAIKEDIEKGNKPFLLVGTGGTTNTGAIDPLEELGDIAEKYNLWYHVDGAYGASILLSSHKDLLKGIEKSDSVSWDGHKWLFQTYGCAAIICKDKMKLLETFHVNPEYLKDVESTEESPNFWDMGIELTKPARGMRLWFTLQTVGIETMKSAIDQSFKIIKWIEDEVKKYDNFEIISKAQLGVINFRYVNDKYTDKELDNINREISKRAIKENYTFFLTTILEEKVVLRFCSVNPSTKKEEIIKIISDIQKWIKEMDL